MTDDLSALPVKIGAPILKAWNVKEDLMDLLALHGTRPNRPEISALLTRFYENAVASGLPEMQRLAGTVSTWWPEILAAITTGVTNAGSEGTNRAVPSATATPPISASAHLPPPPAPADPTPNPDTAQHPNSTVKLDELPSIAAALCCKYARPLHPVPYSDCDIPPSHRDFRPAVDLGILQP